MTEAGVYLSFQILAPVLDPIITVFSDAKATRNNKIGGRMGKKKRETRKTGRSFITKTIRK